MESGSTKPSPPRGGKSQQLLPVAVVAFLRTFLIAAVLVVILGYGWRITEINLVDLAVNAPRIGPIVGDLLNPDILSRDVAKETIDAPIYMPCQADGVTQVSAPDTSGEGAYLVLGQQCVEAGQTVKVEGYNFRPSTRGFIRWLPPEGAPRTLGRVTSDRQGHFEVEIEVPPVRPSETDPHEVEVELQWGVGMPYASEALRITLGRMLETIFLALMATIFAIIAALPLSFLAARNLMTRNPVSTVIYYIVRTIFNALRSIEPLIMAIVFAVWVGIGPFAGVLALAVHSIAALGKLYSEAIESIDAGPIEAITATGANPLQVIVYGVIPQVIPPYVAFTIYRWDINVRMSTIIGMVGGGGIGFILQQWINLFRYRQAGTAVWCIAIVVAVMDYLSSKLRERMV